MRRRSGLVVRRALGHRLLIVAASTTALFAVTVLATLGGYSASVTGKELRTTLAGASFNGAGTRISTTVTARDIPTTQRKIATTVADVYGHIPIAISLSARGDSYVVPGQERSSHPELTAFATYSGIENHAKLTMGRWPADTRTGAIEVALPVPAARAMRLAVGRIVTLYSRVEGPTVTIKVTGLFTVDRPDDYFWGGDRLITSGSERLAVALIGFGSTVEASLDRAQRLATWQSVGGDARVDTLNISPALVDHVRRTPGVRAVVPAQTMDMVGLTSQGTTVDQVTVIGIDLGAYRHLMADTPLSLPAPPARTGALVPAFFSPAAAVDTKAGQLGLSTNWGSPLSLRNAGTIPGFPTQTADAKFVVVPADALARISGGEGTGSIFIRGDHLDAAALRRSAAQPALGQTDAVVVAMWQATRDALTQRALGHLVGTDFGTAAILVAGYGSLAVLVMLLAEAQARGRAVSYLRTLGLSRRQAHGLAVAEVVPVLLAASVSGWVLGLFLPSLIGPALDLRAYTGGSPVTHYVPDLSSTLAITGGLLVFAGLTVLIDAVTGARRGLGSALRIGDT